MNYSQSRKGKTGQSLVEAIAAVAVIMIVLTGLISALVYSLTNARFARNKAESNRYGETAVEWLRVQRDTADSWNDFYNMSASTPGCKHYCPTVPLGSLGLSDLNSYFESDLESCLTADHKLAGTNYVRTITLCNDGADTSKVQATVGVYWRTGRCQGNSFCYHSTVDTEYTNWQ